MIFGIFVRDNQAKNWLVKCFRTQIKVVLVHDRVQDRITLQIKFSPFKTFSFLDSKQYMLQHSRAWPFYWRRRREAHVIWWEFGSRTNSMDWSNQPPSNRGSSKWQVLYSKKWYVYHERIQNFFQEGDGGFFFTGVRMGLVLNTYFQWIKCVEPTIPIPKYV